jgi:hypothetical protein
MSVAPRALPWRNCNLDCVRCPTRRPRAPPSHAARRVPVASVDDDASLNAPDAGNSGSLESDEEAGDDSDGTTSLLVRVRATQCASVREFLLDWLRDYLFAAHIALGPPTSVGCVGNDPALLFYASDGAVRGSLAMRTRPCSEPANDLVLVRVTSRSRFINPSGVVSASLPGERRIVRKLVLDIQDAFGPANVQLLYKPPHIRLTLRGHGGGSAMRSIRAWTRYRPHTSAPSPGDGAGASNVGEHETCPPLSPSFPASRLFGIVFVAKIGCTPLANVLEMVERWGPSAYAQIEIY